VREPDEIPNGCLNSRKVCDQVSCSMFSKYTKSQRHSIYIRGVIGDYSIFVSINKQVRTFAYQRNSPIRTRNKNHMKHIFLFLTVTAALSLTGCGGKSENNTDQSVPPGMMALDLSKYGKNVIIHVPDSTNGPLSVDNSMGEMVRIVVGKSFQIDIKEGEGNMDMKKNEDIKKNEVYKFDKFDVDEPDAIVWSWHMDGRVDDKGAPILEYNMYTARKVGAVTYEVETVPGEVFSMEACKKMLESAKSLRAKEEKKPEA
jgi:hypothetical protein